MREELSDSDDEQLDWLKAGRPFTEEQARAEIEAMRKLEEMGFVEGKDVVCSWSGSPVPCTIRWVESSMSSQPGYSDMPRLMVESAGESVVESLPTAALTLISKGELRFPEEGELDELLREQE